MARTFRELDSPRYATFMGVIAANTEYLDSYGRHDRENRHEVHKIATRFAEKHAGRPDRMHFDYRGLGRVTFFYEGEAGWRAGRVTADPILVERAFPIAPENDMALRMQELLYGGYASARQAIEARQPVSFTPEVKDTIAELLARNYANQKVEFIDDTFWVMSRFLVRSDQGRYGPMIKEIAARSADKRIKKLSEMIDPAAVDAASAYVPGTVRLEEKRLAYPPFYPESTFIGPVGGEDDVQDETPDQTAE
jgi:hypothetical protein